MFFKSTGFEHSHELFPPFCFDHNKTRIVDTNLVSNITRNVCQKSISFSTETGSFNKSKRKESPHDSEELSKASGLDYLRESLNCIKLHKTVSPSTVSRWLKPALRWQVLTRRVFKDPPLLQTR